MFDQIKPLLESGIITKDTAQAINEAWEEKLVESREQVRAELREEFAQRYDHDKTVMVEALDKMITAGLKKEIQEFQSEKQSIKEDRVKTQRKLIESAKNFNSFLTTHLAEEIKEFRKEHALQLEHRKNLEKFVVEALAREVKEFTQDKQAVVEAKVKLVAEGRKQLTALKQKFIAESSSRLNKAVTQQLKGEITQLKEDIQSAKENDFGRKIFESFAGEFSATHLNEKAEVRKLHDMIASKDEKLAEAIQLTQRAKVLVESKEREMRILKESNQREAALEELLSPLNKEKAEVMRNLLESVQTSRLSNAFEKYLPAVLEDRSVKASKVIVESLSEATGDKSARSPDADYVESQSNVIDLKRLAGL